jgi:hypothetical protein
LFFRSPDAKRRRQLQEEDDENRWGYRYITANTESVLQRTTSSTTTNVPIEVPRKTYQVYNILSPKSTSNSIIGSPLESEGSILVAIYNSTNAKYASSVPTCNIEQSLEMGNAWMQPKTPETIDSEVSIIRRTTVADSSKNKWSNMGATHESFHINRQLSNQENIRNFSSPSLSLDHIYASQSLTPSTPQNEQDHLDRRTVIT